MWLLLLVLLCPLAMYFMMRGMHSEHDEHTGHDQTAVPTPLELLQARETLTRGPGAPVA